MKINYAFAFVSLLVGAFLLVFALSLMNFGLFNQNESVKIYYVDNISPTHQKILDKFNADNKGKIEVIPLDIPFYKFSTNERKELLIRALRSKSERIDIFAVDIIWVSRFEKWSENLDQYFSDHEKSRLLEEAKSIGNVDNMFLASPFYLDISVMFYRNDLLRKFKNYEEIEKSLKKSISWKEFLNLASKFDKKENFYTFPADAYEGLICSYTELLLSKDEFFFDNNIDFTNEASVSSLKLLVDLVNKYKISPKQVVNYREKDAYRDFLQNDGLFLRGWQSFVYDFKSLDRDTVKERYMSMTQLPHLEGHRIGSTVGGWSLMLAKNSSKKNEAMKFIKFTLSEEAQKIMYEDGAYLPVLKLLYTDENFLNKHPSLVFSKEILNNSIFRPKLKDYTKISDILSTNIRAAINNELSPKEALKKAQIEIDKARSHQQ